LTLPEIGNNNENQCDILKVRLIFMAVFTHMEVSFDIYEVIVIIELIEH